MMDFLRTERRMGKSPRSILPSRQDFPGVWSRLCLGCDSDLSWGWGKKRISWSWTSDGAGAQTSELPQYLQPIWANIRIRCCMHHRLKKKEKKDEVPVPGNCIWEVVSGHPCFGPDAILQGQNRRVYSFPSYFNVSSVDDTNLRFCGLYFCWACTIKWVTKHIQIGTILQGLKTKQH
jgi:hypothetical protein